MIDLSSVYICFYQYRDRCALAESYERIDKIEEAIKCYLRAEGNRDREGIALRYMLCAHQSAVFA